MGIRVDDDCAAHVIERGGGSKSDRKTARNDPMSRNVHNICTVSIKTVVTLRDIYANTTVILGV